jgi:hypothetical protein
MVAANGHRLLHLIVLDAHKEGGVSTHKEASRGGNLGYKKAFLAQVGVYRVSIVIVYDGEKQFHGFSAFFQIFVFF